MNKANLNVRKDRMSSDFCSLLHKQERILLKIRKENHQHLDRDAERMFLRECNDNLRTELFNLNRIIKGLMPAGGHT